MGASSVRDERGTDAPADLRPRLCGSSSSAMPCLRGGAPSWPLDTHSVTGRHRSPPPEALSRGAVRWPLPASTRVLTAPRAARSPPKTPPAGPYAAGDDLPSRLPRARDSGAATAADTPVSSDRGLGVVLSEATTGLETGTAVRRTAFSNGSPRGTPTSHRLADSFVSRARSDENSGKRPTTFKGKTGNPGSIASDRPCREKRFPTSKRSVRFARGRPSCRPRSPG